MIHTETLMLTILTKCVDDNEKSHGRKLKKSHKRKNKKH